MEVGEDNPCSQPAAHQLLQRGHERIQPRLVLGRGHPVVPGGGATLDGCEDRPVASKPVRNERAPQVPSIQRKKEEKEIYEKKKEKI
jgi:hypothetical protein